MATIIPFRRNQNASRPAAKRNSPAKIVIFPGVRYERAGQAPTPQQPLRPNRKRREGAD